MQEFWSQYPGGPAEPTGPGTPGRPEVPEFPGLPEVPWLPVLPCPGVPGGGEKESVRSGVGEQRYHMVNSVCGVIYRGGLGVLWGLGLQRLETLSPPFLLVDLQTHKQTHTLQSKSQAISLINSVDSWEIKSTFKKKNELT